jgi:uncharacterized protein (TIGR00725 family)
MAKQNREYFPIAVIGKEKINYEDEQQVHALEQAYQLGKELAKENIVVISGGLGGIMEAVSKGCYEQNGISVGIIPILDSNERPKRIICEYLTCKINTGMDQRVRIPLLINSCKAVVVISGGTGTWLEAGFALANKTPIIALVNSGGVAERLRHEPPFKENVYCCQTIAEIIKILKCIKSEQLEKQ